MVTEQRIWAQRIAKEQSMNKEWTVEADQWMQEYWEYRDGIMIRIIHDNKDGYHDEIPLSLADFFAEYGSRTDAPFPEICEYLRRLP